MDIMMAVGGASMARMASVVVIGVFVMVGGASVVVGGASVVVMTLVVVGGASVMVGGASVVVMTLVVVGGASVVVMTLVVVGIASVDVVVDGHSVGGASVNTIPPWHVRFPSLDRVRPHPQETFPREQVMLTFPGNDDPPNSPPPAMGQLSSDTPAAVKGTEHGN